MNREFEAEYARLNAAQKEAVNTIEGPVLVVAGPGTGKTQLLSLRVANILRQTDVTPGNILCLTFTDNAARNMRERLQTVIGQPAYHVSIHTFHSFGSDIINQYGDFFTDRRMLQPVDELGRYELLRGIFDDLPHSNPLSAKVGDDFVFLKDTLSLISWLKQNALTPDELRQIIVSNQAFMNELGDLIAETFAATPSPKYLASYNDLLDKIQSLAKGETYFGFNEYATACAAELAAAIESTPAEGRYATAITAWRNAWCHKDADGRHVFKDAGRNTQKMLAVAEIYETLSGHMAEQGLFDFDDMIVEVVHALEQNDELRFNLQERYQYVLVDEFQDTNKAQLRMLSALGDNPVHEQRPNIMAVGDDDQAIYSFQGAEVSNMVAFARQYRQPKLITLKENWRSTPNILDAAFAVAGEISDRLESALPIDHKRLKAKAEHEINILEHNLFASELAQYDWIAEKIGALIEGGTKPEQIAVIAPRHRYLERLMPYLGQKRLPVAYERRENILESPIILQILNMTKLVVALSENQQSDTDALLSEVLGYDFWTLPAETLMGISLEAYNKHQHWLPILAEHENKSLVEIVKWFTNLAKRSRLEPLEYILDQLVGGIGDGIDSEYDELVKPDKAEPSFSSPLRQFYFSSERYEQATDVYLALLGQLSSLRQSLRQWKPAQALYAKDLVAFAELHQAAGLKIIDTNPHTQSTNAVQVMTAYKAKGLEFDVVFMINAQDEIWGPTARSRSSSISLPKNLPIAPPGDDDNDKLRLLFVALTRSRHTLFITSYSHTLENKLSPGLSFIINDHSEPIHSGFTPKPIDKPASAQAVEILTTDWAYRFRQVIADKPSLFEPILANYKLSVTHLNNFLDVVNGGPQYFLLHNLLRFPEAPTPSAAYGDAVHKSLQWSHLELRKNDSLPDISAIQDYFADILASKQLRRTDHKRLGDRGKLALERYFKERGGSFIAQDSLERGFNNEGVVINNANLSGKIDKMHYAAEGSVEVIDFKTGKPTRLWQGKDDYERLKLHKYRQQLMFYKLLIENSASFSGRLTVTAGALEFIETDDSGKLVNNLVLDFNDKELLRFKQLIGAVWQHIVSLDFPAINNYAPNIKGVNQFEQDLIDGII